jgi:AcrR family transcriptional regulator
MSDGAKPTQTTLAEIRSVATETGRINQKLRTRAALVAAAAELLSAGSWPTIAEVAERAMVSTTTAYRYFASIDALVEEVFFDRDWPTAEEVLAAGGDAPLQRVLQVEAAVNGALLANERAMRVIVRNSLDVWLDSDGGQPALRPGRRLEMIDAALEPLADEIDRSTLELLRNGLALVIGTEAMIAARDVCGLDHERAHHVARWAAEALLTRALGPARSGDAT